MAIQTQIITGRLSEPDGDPVTTGSVRFTLNRYDATDNGVIAASRKIEAPIAVDGSIALELWPNTAGLRGTTYLVELISERGYPVETYGRIQVGEDGPYSLADLIREDLPPATTSYWSTLTQAQYDAAIEAVDLSQAWAEGTEPGGTGTKSAQEHAADAGDQATAAATSAAQAALYDGVWLDDVATVIADTSLSYGPGASGVSEGDYVRTRAEGFSYQVAAEDATDHHLTTAGGVKLEVLPGADGAYHSAAFGVVGPGDETTALTAAMAAAENGTLVIDRPVLGSFISDRLIPAGNTKIIIQPGTNFNVLTGGSRAFQVQAENVHIWAYGATTTMDGTQSSHNVYFNAGGTSIAKNCSVRGLHAIGSGNSGDDCFYIGGDVANGAIPENIQIIDCKGQGFGAGTRNGLSVVACDGYLVEGCEFWNCTGAPGAGIDIEANVYKNDGTSAIRRGVIRRNKVHDNVTGIAVVFGDDCLVEENEAYDNAGDGIGSAAGGTQFDDEVYRAGDRLGIISFAADGWITVEDATQLTADLGIDVGTIVSRRTSGGAAWPAAFTSTYYVVNEISADQFSFRIGVYYGYGTVSTVTGSGTGTLSKDPTVSEMGFHVYREGNNSNITFRRNKLYGNGTVNGQMKLAQMVNVTVDDNKVDSGHVGIGITYSKSVTLRANRVRATEKQVTGYRGINIGVCSGVQTHMNKIRGFGGEGLQFNGSNGTFIDDIITNCGYVGNRAARFQNGSGMKISPIITNDDNHRGNLGLVCENTAVNALVTGARCKGAGNSNGNSISVGAGSRVIDSIQYDGTFRANTA